MQQVMGPGLAYLAMTSEESYSVPQFTGVQDNLQLWKARVRALVMEKGAHEALKLKKEETQTEYQKKAAHKACSVILHGLGDVPLAAVVMHVDDRKEMWDALSNRYQE